MVCATMGNSNLEAAAIDWKHFYRVLSFFPFRKCKCGPGKTPNHESQESFEIHEESDRIEDKRGNTRIRNDKNQRNTNESEESFEIQEESDKIEDRRGNTRLRNDKNQRNTN